MTSSSASSEVRRKRKHDKKAWIPVLLLQIILASTLTIGWIYGGYYHCDSIPLPQSNSLRDTWVYYARCCVLPCALVLFFSIIAVMNQRVGSPAGDPLAGNEQLLQLEKNILTNTVEQMVLFLMISLVLITYLDISEMRIIPIFATHWVISRIVFNIGYRIGSRYRSLGMVSNFFANFVFLGLVCFFVYSRGFMYKVSDPGITGAGQSEGKPEL